MRPAPQEKRSRARVGPSPQRGFSRRVGSKVASSASHGETKRSDASKEENRTPSAKEAYGDFRVLIVDDLATNRKVLHHLVGKLGAQAETCDSGEDAIALISRNHYHLILLDLHMPSMSGFEAGEKIIREREGSLPLVVAQTADETSRACDRTREIGFDGHITKPIRSAKVQQFLRQIGQFAQSH